MARNDPQMNLRVPAELKNKIEIAAFENNRTITAEAVARLEQSFSSSAESFSSSTVASSLNKARKNYFINQLNNLNYHLGCLEGKISACNYIVNAIRNGTGKKYDTDADMQRELFKFEILLEQAVVEKENIEKKLRDAIQELQAYQYSF